LYIYSCKHGVELTGFFTKAMDGTGIILNARCAGFPEKIEGTIRELTKPGMKTVLVTHVRALEKQQKIIRFVRDS